MAETPLTDSIEALTTYANQVTGASDTNLSDAVYTLAQGYGGGDITTAETTFTGDGRYGPFNLACPFEPDIVVITSPLDFATAGWVGLGAHVFIKNVLTCSFVNFLRKDVSFK